MGKLFTMEYTILLWLFGLYSTTEVQATTHWMVTETGLIKPRVETPFEMARPYDLLAFLNQDTRWENIKKLYVDLSKQQLDINKMWTDLVKETDINTYLGLDKNCVKAGSLSDLNWYSAFMEEGLSKHIPEDDFLLFTPAEVDAKQQAPDCKKKLSVVSSLFTFEHLESMKNISDLKISPELSLPELVSPLMTVDQFGHWLQRVLSVNDTSWIHYNMASLFWRTQGNAVEAVECSRRAVYLAPRVYKDVPLLSLGSILHRAKKSQDASIILKAAVDHDPSNIYANFILANAYAITGEFDLSLKYFEMTLRLNPGFEQAERNKYGLLCQRELIKKMLFINKKIKALREVVANFTAKEEVWLQIQAHFLTTRKHSDEDLDYLKVDNIVTKMTELMGINMKDLKKEGDKNAVIQYFLNGPLYSDQWFTERGVQIIDAAFSIQRLMKHIEKQGKISPDEVFVPDFVNVSSTTLKKELGPRPTVHLGRHSHLLCGTIQTEEAQMPEPPHTTSTPKTKTKDIDEIEEYEVGLPIYPNTMKINRNAEEFDRDPSWPPEHVCQEASLFPHGDSALVVYPVFLPFENKGLSVKGILTDKIGVSADVEHELPWHPPTCPASKEAATALKKAHKTQLSLELVPLDLLLVRLRTYVSGGQTTQAHNMQHAEIGHRIYTAMENNVAPKWMIYTLASLYWRVRNNNQNALNCLMSANKEIKHNKFKDIVYTSMASVYLEMGYVDESLKFAEEAYKISMYEPATNFILFQINTLKKNRNSQMFHLKQVVRVDGDYMSGRARSLLTAWACVYRRPHTVYKDVESDDSEACEREAADTHARSHADTHAHTHARTREEHDASNTLPRSTLGRLMLLAEPSVKSESMDTSVFDTFIANTPADPSDKDGHTEHMRRMVELINSLQGCGSKGCHSITKEKMRMRAEECLFQYIQLQHWLQTITVRYYIADDVRLISEVTSVTVPFTKRVPECQVYDDPTKDYFLEQILKVETDGWEPKNVWKKMLTEYFQFTDFDTLGAKLAKYVDAKPRLWWALLTAGWWCGVSGRGGCAVRCLAAAYRVAPHQQRTHPLIALLTLLHRQYKSREGARIAYLAFYLSPKSRVEAFAVAASNIYLGNYDSGIWMFRYALTFDEKFLPSKACVHATMCLLLFPDTARPAHEISEQIEGALSKQHEGIWSLH